MRQNESLLMDGSFRSEFRVYAVRERPEGGTPNFKCTATLRRGWNGKRKNAARSLRKNEEANPNSSQTIAYSRDILKLAQPMAGNG